MVVFHSYLRLPAGIPTSQCLKKNCRSERPWFKIFGSLVVRKSVEWSMSAHFTDTLCRTSLCHSMPSLRHLKSGSGRSSCRIFEVKVVQGCRVSWEHP